VVGLCPLCCGEREKEKTGAHRFKLEKRGGKGCEFRGNTDWGAKTKKKKTGRGANRLART